MNVRSSSLEQTGDGASGRKASGLLSLDGQFYLWARNAGASQIAWSDDEGASWTWADWKFETRFGCPTFVNYGKNYAGNNDGYVHIVSQDAKDAYTPSDQFILARVEKHEILGRDDYEFFAGVAKNGSPIWTTEIRECGSILTRPDECYRAGVTYNSGLDRYRLVHAVPNKTSRDPRGRLDVRFHGGLAVYEAPDPWGPWSVAFETDSWDAGPGDSASFPTKWISADGRVAQLVFSGDDSFSLREAEFVVR